MASAFETGRASSYLCKGTEVLESFDMSALRSNLPQNNKRGLSRYYPGKSCSFTSMTDIHCVEDLKKQGIPDAKKRKKYSSSGEKGLSVPVPPAPCRSVSSTTHCATPSLHI